MDVLDKVITEILNPIIVLLFALAVGYFLWGLLKFIKNQDNATEQEEGKRHMVWAVVGFFVMFAVDGILKLIQSTIGQF